MDSASPIVFVISFPSFIVLSHNGLLVRFAEEDQAENIENNALPGGEKKANHVSLI